MSTTSDVVRKARDAFDSHRTRDVEFRLDQLYKLRRLLDVHEMDVATTLLEDLNKPLVEGMMMDVFAVRNEVLYHTFYLEEWLRNENVSKPVHAFFEDRYVTHDPVGVVLIIGAWNYPMFLLLVPLIGAISAGCCAILKPSDVSSLSAKLLAEILPQYLDKECYQVFEGGADATQELLKEKFDHIFFTGSMEVGKSIYETAASKMSRVNLEMSGKNPVYVDDTSNLEFATRRLLWGKFVSCGQTCIAPDYLLCTEKVRDAIMSKSLPLITEWFGDPAYDSIDYGRIGNRRHFDKLMRLMEGCHILQGGKNDPGRLCLEPTIVGDVKESDAIANEEVFGPILPIIIVSGLEEAVEYINKRGKPLALYVFSTDDFTINTFIYNTFSGSMGVNDTMGQLILETTPFGGLGKSGFGLYRGKFTFELLSHKKAVLSRTLGRCEELLSWARYPPYSKAKTEIMKMLQKRRSSLDLKMLWYTFTFLFGVLSGYWILEEY